MDNLPPLRSGRCWRLAGIAFFSLGLLPASLLPAPPAHARTQIDFSLDREFRGRVASSFARTLPAPTVPSAMPMATLSPAQLPPVSPPRPGHGAAEANRQGLTLLKLRFAF